MKYADGTVENHIIVNGAIPNSFMVDYIGSGQNGICYLTSDGQVFKETTCEEKYYEDLKTLTKLQSDYFAFPKTLVYHKERSANNLKGYLMDYVDGEDIRSVSGNTDIKLLMKHAETIERELYELTKNEGLIMYEDLHYGNVLYKADYLGFKIIDTDFYTFKPLEDFYNNFRENIKIWSEFLLYSLMSYNYFKNDKISCYFEQAIHQGKCRPSLVLGYVIEEIEKEKRENIQTLDEFNEGLKLIKK